MLQNQEKYCIIIHGDVFGIDDIFEIRIASGGFSLATLTNGKIKLNADNQELAFAA